MSTRTRARNLARLAVPAVLALLGVTLLVGCIYIPTFNATVDGPDAASKIGPADSKKPLRVGRSTRRDVERVLGKPYFTTSDGRLWVYSWRRRNGVYFYPLCFRGGAMDDAFASVIEFNERDVVERFENETRRGDRDYVPETSSARRFTPYRAMMWDAWVRVQANPSLLDANPPEKREELLRRIKAATQPSPTSVER